MSKWNQISILVILALIICAPLVLMPVYIQQNNEDVLTYDNKQPMSLDDIMTLGSVRANTETYFNEHLPLRHSIISIWSNFMYRLGVSVKPNTAIVGRDGWIYLGNDYYQVFDLHRGLLTVSEEDVGRSASRLLALKMYCDNRGIDFYFAVPPDKEVIYPEYYPKWYSKSENARYMIRLTEHLACLNAASYSEYLEDVMIDKKQEFGNLLFYKSDSHWTNLGGYIGYASIMGEIINTYGAEYKMIKLQSYSVEAYEQTDIKRLLGISVNVGDHYVKTEFIPNSSVQAEKVTPALTKYENNDALTDKAILCFADSFLGSMLPFLTNTFHEVYVIHYNSSLKADNINNFYEAVEYCSPDLILLLSVERQVIPTLLEMPEVS